MNKEIYELRYKLYKKWFKSNLFLFALSIEFYIYERFFATFNWLLLLSFMFIIMTIGWGATALGGMINCRKKIKEGENN